jgi:hypothetical protein
MRFVGERCGPDDLGERSRLGADLASMLADRDTEDAVEDSGRRAGWYRGRWADHLLYFLAPTSVLDVEPRYALAGWIGLLSGGCIFWLAAVIPPRVEHAETGKCRDCQSPPLHWLGWSVKAGLVRTVVVSSAPARQAFDYLRYAGLCGKRCGPGEPALGCGVPRCKLDSAH